MRKTVLFGSWEGKPLEWLVLQEDDTTLTLFCKQTVGTMPFSQKCCAYYAESDVRAFLEGEFYQTAFSPAEKTRIKETELDCTEYQTYYGAVSAGATAYRREPLTARVFLLSVREIMKTYALTPEELYRPSAAKFWSRSPYNHQDVSLIYCGDGILRGESPYTYESSSYDYTVDEIKTSTVPYSTYANKPSAVIPALRIAK